MPASFVPSVLEPDSTPAQAPADMHGGMVATFLYARLRHFGKACLSMSGVELTSFVNEVRRVLSSSVLRLEGRIARRRPDSILAVFSNPAETPKPNHAQRALHAALLCVQDAVQLSELVAQRLQGAGLPPLVLTAGVHLGDGEVTPRITGAPEMVHAAGEAVEIARLLEAAALELHWGVATSAQTRLAAADRIQPGRVGSLSLPNGDVLNFVEVVGMGQRQGSRTPPHFFEQLRQAVQQNQRLSRNGSAAASGCDAYPE